MEQYNTLHINNLEFKEYVNPMYFEALEDNSTVRLNKVGEWSGKTFRISKTNALNSYYDYDWSDIITLNEGERVYWYSGQLGQYSTTQYMKFQMTGKIKAGGNIQSLMNYSTSAVEMGFYKLFGSCSALVDVSDLLLPATTLAFGCYRNMFGACTSLTEAPELPATTLSEGCYQEMFYNCISLTTAPELPATTLAHGCYNTMFYNCISLTTAPAILPATTLADYCYQNMFYRCTSLTTAPELPAITFQVLPEPSLGESCYFGMFNGCSSLNYIKCMLDEYPSNPNDNLDIWVSGVSSTGTFVKSPNATWSTGANGIPSGWTVVDAS